MNEAYYSAEQIAQILHIHPKTVQRYIREGRLRAAKIGKSWRVSGHDFSVFAEAGTQPSDRTDVPGKKRVTASSVVEIEVAGKDEAVRILNTMTAAMNGKPPEYGRSSLHAQFLEHENKVRLTLWGEPVFLAAALDAVAALTRQDVPFFREEG